ncbi:MAG: hypothetical protein WC586_11875 [Methanoregula sp.]
MLEANRYRIELIREISRYSLIGLLIINILSPFVIIFINPEAYLLGQKIAGPPALVYALGLFLITTFVMFCLSTKTKGNEVIALVYGVIFFINGYLNTLNITGRNPPAMYWFILAVSVLLSGATLLNAYGGSKREHNKKISTVFMEKPFAGLTVAAVVFLCFVLFTAFSLLMYQFETNDYDYQIGIDPDTPLHNITLLLPYPSGFFKNNTQAEIRVGESPWYFTNYSQSVVETKTGPMLKITADSLEKQQNESSQGPVQLYQRFLDEGAHSSPSFSYRQPVLSPQHPPEPASCSETQFQEILPVNTPDCSRFESGIYAAFETDPASHTVITASFNRMHMISSSHSPQRDESRERITTMISGSGNGWYNASGVLAVFSKR